MASTAAGPASERQDTTVPDEDHGVDIPMTMSASVVLTSLPSDATQALAQVDAMDERKGTLTKAFHSLTHSLTVRKARVSEVCRNLIC